MENLLQKAYEVHRDTFAALIESQAEAIERVGRRIVDSLAAGGKILAFGNGGSAADAQHLAGELVVRFETDRRGLPAIALTTNSSVLTAAANDLGYDRTFARGVEAFAQPGDLCLGISTSGRSPSVTRALEKARTMGVATAGLSGRDGGELTAVCDEIVVVPHDQTCRVQEAHVFCIHVWCAMVDAHFKP